MIKPYRKYLLSGMLLLVSIAAFGSDWGEWSTAPSDNLISYRVKQTGVNGYSGLCQWSFQIRNDHNYTADVLYIIKGQPFATVPFDHKALQQSPGQVNDGGIALPCSNIYLDARGDQSN
jgi:hypothetical protein